MAGDWIKLREDLKDDPAVLRMSKATGLDPWGIVGRLSDIWAWIGRHTATGNDVPLDSDMLDMRVHTPGFANAMRAVGWLKGEDGSLHFPEWERHNSRSAKARALESEAKNLRRSVSGNCPTKSDENVRPEKRREEKKKETPVGVEPAAPKPRKQPEGDHPEFIRRWVEEYPNHHGGEAYALCGPKDGALVSSLLKSCKKTPEEWQRIFVAAWKHPELFNCKAAASIGGFVSRFNEIRDELNALNKGAKVAVSALPSSEDLYATGQ